MFVEAQVVGRPGAGVEPREIDYAPGARVPLRVLIAHVVRAEVNAFADRERERRFVRVLSREEIDRGARAGRVDPGGRPAGPSVDPDAAVRVAVEAFEDGLYFVFVDDRQVEELEELVEVGPTTRVRFVRLMALAGG
jgi:hypothetical protein